MRQAHWRDADLRVANEADPVYLHVETWSLHTPAGFKRPLLRQYARMPRQFGQPSRR